MHVLVVTIVHHPEDARIRYRQIRALLDAGHRVTYVAPFDACEVVASTDLHAVSVPRAAGRRRLAAVRAARAAVKAHGPAADLIVLHDPELILAVRGLRDLPPVVWDVHEDTAAAVTLKPWLPAATRRVVGAAAAALERAAERKHHLLLAEESYLSRFRRSHPVVPNAAWVPATVHPPGSDRLIYVGHLTRARGALEMITVAHLLQGVVEVELVGSADSETRRVLEGGHAEGAPLWRGFLPNSAALDRVDGALAGLSLLHDEPNYRHSRPTKVIEYMAHGVPVITTPVPAAREIVECHGAGIVVPFGDPSAVADAVKQLREDTELRTTMGRRGHDAARDHYAWPRHARRFVAQLEEWASG